MQRYTPGFKATSLTDRVGLFNCCAANQKSLPLVIFPNADADATSEEPGDARAGNGQYQLSTDLLKIPTDLPFPMVDEQLEPREAPFCTIARLWYLG